MSSILIYDVEIAPYHAPWNHTLDPQDAQTLRAQMLNTAEHPEIFGNAAEILRDNEGTDEYDNLKLLVDRDIDYFVFGAAGGSLDLYVAVRSKEDFRKFVDHMTDHYAADQVLESANGEDIFVHASSGRFTEPH